MKRTGLPIPFNAMHTSFREFLEAKYFLDERSFNQSVQSIFLTELKNRDNINLLDVGTGTGAMLQRMILNQSAASLRLTGVDKDAELIRAARSKILSLLKKQNCEITQGPGFVLGTKPAAEIRTIFEHCSLDKFFHGHRDDRFDIITASAFMDIMPLGPTVKLFAEHLAGNGLFYATINYDGETALFPGYPDEQFENELLQAYDASMEARVVYQQRTGGARSGRRLLDAMQNIGLEIIAYGTSDWNITPIRKNYLDQDQTCILHLLELLLKEGQRRLGLDNPKLNHWFDDRVLLTQKSGLGIIVHQLDILGKKLDS